MVMKKVQSSSSSSSSSSSKEADRGGGGFKLFGVQIGGNGVESSVIRKSKSLDSLQLACKAEINGADASGYLSDGLVHQSSFSRGHERKKGKPWTEEEHRLFLTGLEKLGKGDWKGIASNFVLTRNSSQVASHAQKYFIRKSAVEKKRRRASVFDMPLSETTTNQLSQVLPGSSSAVTSQPASKPAASVRTTVELKGQACKPVPVTTCERPPLSPMKRPGIPNFHTMLYAPRGGSRFPPGFPTQTGVPTVSWVPVVNFPNPTSVFLPSIHGAFATCATSVPQPSVVVSRQGSSSQQSTTAPATKNDELNLDIRKLTL